MLWIGVAAIVSSGCMVGAGPTLSFGPQSARWSYGIEAIGGSSIGPQAAMGYTSMGHTTYGRLDLAFGPAQGWPGDAENDKVAGVHVGAGYGAGDNGASGIFNIGGLGGLIVSDAMPPPRAACPKRQTAVTLTIDLRYLREWWIVVQPRIDDSPGFGTFGCAA
jgi:hypothetical protein